MIYVSIDLETTGLDPARDQVLAIGAIAYDHESQSELGAFETVLRYERLEGSPFALHLNGELLKRIVTNDRVSVPSAAWRSFVEWLRQWPKPATAAGKNFASFDRPFIERATFTEHGKLFHHRSLDPVTLWTDPATDVVPPDTAECCRRAGLPDTVAHDALADARQVIALLEAGWRRRA